MDIDIHKDTLDEREFELINIIGGELALNQRDLSHRMDLSLGMTNMLIRRLISKGYIRIRQLNKRKVEYILTPKGFAEKMRKSVRYTVKTLHSIGLIKENLRKIFSELHTNGEKHFYILGDSDFVTLVELTIKEAFKEDYTITHIKDLPKEEVDGIVLICKEGYENKKNGKKTINLIEELAKNHIY